MGALGRESFLGVVGRTPSASAGHEDAALSPSRPVHFRQAGGPRGAGS